jgi:phosphonate transport system substrate-binding protein
MTALSRMFAFIHVGLSLCLIAAAPLNATAAEPMGTRNAHPSDVLMLARISNNPKKQLPRLDAMSAYLAGKLQDVGIREVRSIVVPDRETMAQYLRDGKVDFFSETVLTSLYLEKHGNAQILMREWKKGVSSYRSIIVVSKESSISELSNLRGRKIAFEDPGSTSGFLLPYAALVNDGLTLRRLNSPRSTVATGEIGYVFADL